MPREELYDRVLVSVGRVPNLADLGLENTKVTKDDKGFIQCNSQQQTEDPNIYAVGDVNGGALLAHMAFKEAKIAVEAILGEASAFENIVVPAVVFTDPGSRLVRPDREPKPNKRASKSKSRNFSGALPVARSLWIAQTD